MSQNNSITCVLFSGRDCGWTGPDIMHQDLTWQRPIHTWSDAELRFALQAITDRAPTATNLRRWDVSTSEVDPACIMCGKPASLRHVLNGCPVALHQGRCTWRHTSVLSAIRHMYRLNTFCEQHPAGRTSNRFDKAKSEVHSVRARRSTPPASNHVTQRKPSCCNVSKARCSVIFSLKQDIRPP